MSPLGFRTEQRQKESKDLLYPKNYGVEAELPQGRAIREIPSPAMGGGLFLKPRVAEPLALNSSLDDIWDIFSEAIVSLLCGVLA